jgi:hypothetical protein
MKKSLTNQREKDEKYGNLSSQILSSGIMLTLSVVNKINVCYTVLQLHVHTWLQFRSIPSSCILLMLIT